LITGLGASFLKTLAIIIAGCFLLTSCASQKVTPATVHLESSSSDPEHDEIVSEDGVADFYPNRFTPHDIVYIAKNGGTTGLTCLNAGCSQMLLKSHGSDVYPDGSFQLVKTDDPNVMMIRDVEGTRVLGFAAKNHGGEWKVLPDLEQAQAFEHRGDTARTVGKIVVGVLVVGLLIAVVGAAAAADAKANTVTTKCSSFFNTTTCTTR
jgi:hypothetical protein